MKVIEPGLRGMRQQGFDKVPLFDIAKDLGVTHAPLYTHFADRSALLDAITERWLNETSIVLDDVCRSRKTPLKKIEERFVAIYQMKRDHMLVDPEPYRAFDLAASLEIHFVVEHIRRLMTQLEQMLEEALTSAMVPIRSSEPPRSYLREPQPFTTRSWSCRLRLSIANRCCGRSCNLF